MSDWLFLLLVSPLLVAFVGALTFLIILLRNPGIIGNTMPGALFGGPQPSAPPPPPPPPNPPQPSNTAVEQSGAAARTAAAAAAGSGASGFSGTDTSGPQGAAKPPTAVKALLGE